MKWKINPKKQIKKEIKQSQQYFPDVFLCGCVNRVILSTRMESNEDAKNTDFSVDVRGNCI